MKNKKILLVEDDPAIIDIYQAMLAKGGFEVQNIPLGADVISMLKQVGGGEVIAPDLILLDLTLPDMNGMDVLAAARQGEATKNIPVFILTNQQESEAPKIEGISADKFIIKANITPTELVSLVRQELG